MKSRRAHAKRYLVFALAIVAAALAVRAVAGATKTDFHVDEGFSAAITNGTPMPWVDRVPRGQWLDGKNLFALCFSDTLNARGSADFGAIARSTAADVHPPLYYWTLALVRVVLGPDNFVLAGLALNMLLFAFSCALITLIAFRAWKDWPVALLTLALFAFSSVSISLTVFIRMYELLQALCLSFLACATLVLFPPEDSRLRHAALPFGIAGLLVCAFLGLLTHYYFLLFVAPVAAFSVVYLALKRRPVALLWSILAVAVGLYLAYRAFPQMEEHLLFSYRAGQGFSALEEATGSRAMENIRAFFRILSRSLVPFPLVFAVIAIAAFERFRNRGKNRERENGPTFFTGALPPFLLGVMIFALTFSVIAISAPYQSARYIGSFYPEYVLAFTGLACLLLSKKPARMILCAAVILVVVHGLNPANLNAFHEDYTVDGDTQCLRDGKPFIVMTTGEGGSWRNLLPYMNAGKAKRVFVATAPSMVDVSARLSGIARSSGEAEVYAIVDNYSTPPVFERIGHFGFFEVYCVPGK